MDALVGDGLMPVAPTPLRNRRQVRLRLVHSTPQQIPISAINATSDWLTLFVQCHEAGPCRVVHSSRPIRLLRFSLIAAIALSIGAAGPSALSAAEQQLNPKAISITLPDQFQWKRK